MSSGKEFDRCSAICWWEWPPRWQAENWSAAFCSASERDPGPMSAVSGCSFGQEKIFETVPVFAAVFRLYDETIRAAKGAEI